MFPQFLLFLTALLASVFALPLVQRDVVSPPITSPKAGDQWHVGQTQTVTWNTTGLPTQQTNPQGMLVLGYWYNNSENLMLNSPLATNLNYSVGQAQITVPNVPSRNDYIVVLFGNSGNASPEFTIINDASSSSSVASSPASESSSNSPGSSTPAASTPTSTPSPVSPNSPGSPGSGSSPTLVNGSSKPAAAGAIPTPTTPSSRTTAVSSTTVTITSATPSSTQSSAAWQKHVPSLGTSLGVSLTIIYFALA